MEKIERNSFLVRSLKNTGMQKVSSLPIFFLLSHLYGEFIYFCVLKRNIFKDSETDMIKT